MAAGLLFPPEISPTLVSPVRPSRLSTWTEWGILFSARPVDRPRYPSICWDSRYSGNVTSDWYWQYLAVCRWSALGCARAGNGHSFS